MPKISIRENNYSYAEDDVVNFAEGLVGLPNMRKAVFIALPDYNPFYWLASLSDEETRFIVVNPNEMYTDFSLPKLPELETLSILDQPNSVLSIVKISSDWKKTTVNLRAPILLNWKTKKGVQVILSDNKYQLAEPLPQT